MSREIALLSGTTHPTLAMKIAQIMGSHLYTVKVNRFSNGETCVDIMESVREKDVYIVQPTGTDPNDSIMELLILTDAVRRASAYRITAVIPCFGYGRQDKKEFSRASISAKLVANMIERSGVDRVLTVDLHTDQLQGFFNIPVDNLYADQHHINYILNNIEGGERVIVSPGVSAVLRAKRISDLIDCPLAIVHFGTITPGATRDDVVGDLSDFKVVGEIKGKIAILVSDLADSCTVEAMIAEALIQQGATKVYMMSTHGILSDNAVDRIMNSYITELIVTNTVPCHPKLKDCSKLRVVDISGLLSDAIRRIHYGDSISALFKKSIASLSMVEVS